MSIHWNKPTLGYVFNGSDAFPQEYDVIEIPNEGVWTYWVIQQVSGSPPITRKSQTLTILGDDTLTVLFQIPFIFTVTTSSCLDIRHPQTLMRRP